MPAASGVGYEPAMVTDEPPIDTDAAGARAWVTDSEFARTAAEPTAPRAPCSLAMRASRPRSMNLGSATAVRTPSRMMTTMSSTSVKPADERPALQLRFPARSLLRLMTCRLVRIKLLSLCRKNAPLDLTFLNPLSRLRAV